MSGGSYDYLCAKDSQEVLTRQEDIRRMADRLAGLGYAEDAAAETEDLLAFIRQYDIRASVRLRRLFSVWKAVEWWDSHDWSEERVREALAKYREEHDSRRPAGPPDVPQLPASG